MYTGGVTIIISVYDINALNTHVCHGVNDGDGAESKHARPRPANGPPSFPGPRPPNRHRRGPRPRPAHAPPRPLPNADGVAPPRLHPRPPARPPPRTVACASVYHRHAGQSCCTVVVRTLLHAHSVVIVVGVVVVVVVVVDFLRFAAHLETVFRGVIGRVRAKTVPTDERNRRPCTDAAAAPQANRRPYVVGTSVISSRLTGTKTSIILAARPRPLK